MSMYKSKKKHVYLHTFIDKGVFRTQRHKCAAYVTFNNHKLEKKKTESSFKTDTYSSFDSNSGMNFEL